MNNLEFQIGQLTAEVKNLRDGILIIHDKMDVFNDSIEGLKLWKARLIGMSLAMSLICSILSSVIIIWRK